MSGLAADALELSSEQWLANHTISLATNLVAERTASLTWHFANYPGLFGHALGDRSEQVRLHDLICQDYVIFNTAGKFGRKDSFLNSCRRCSAFNETVVLDMAQAMADPFTFSLDQRLALAVETTHGLFNAYGQTKIVEDTFRVLRESETKSPAGVIPCVRQLHVAAQAHVLESHGRTPPAHEPPPPAAKLDPQFFDPTTHKPSVNCVPITGPLRWPAFSPMSARKLAARMDLLRTCAMAGNLEEARQSWRSCLIPRGTVVRQGDADDCFISLGPVHDSSLLAWRLRSFVCGDTTMFHFGLPSDTDLPLMCWVHVLDWDDFEILPCEPIPPIRMFYLSKGRLEEPLGVAFHQTAPPQTLLTYAAEHAFFDLGIGILKRIKKTLNLAIAEAETIVDTLTDLITTVLPDLEADRLQLILMSRGKMEAEITHDDMPPELAQEIFDVSGDYADVKKDLDKTTKNKTRPPPGRRLSVRLPALLRHAPRRGRSRNTPT